MLDFFDPELVEFVKRYYDYNGYRYYHNWDHVLHFLEAINSVDKDEWGIFYTEACYGALFHDIIYDPLNKDNEHKSSNLANVKLDAYRKHIHVGDVCNFILMTRKHGYYDFFLHKEEKMFLDCDMAIFADTYENFKLYCSNIEKEYTMYFYSEEKKRMFARKRAEFLLNLYKTKHIYRSGVYRSLYEEKARENLERYFGELLSLSMKSE